MTCTAGTGRIRDVPLLHDPGGLSDHIVLTQGIRIRRNPASQNEIRLLKELASRIPYINDLLLTSAHKYFLRFLFLTDSIDRKKSAYAPAGEKNARQTAQERNTQKSITQTAAKKACLVLRTGAPPPLAVPEK